MAYFDLFGKHEQPKAATVIVILKLSLSKKTMPSVKPFAAVAGTTDFGATDQRRRWSRAEPVGESGSRREPQGIPIQPDATTARTVVKLGGLGITLLYHQLHHNRHPWSGPQRQTRSHHRDMGTPKGT
ncbi:Uncharacterized protein Adt_46980 [Abeliophyllum distichum]|uniref:Uncharacterized protein n=1 Tax=Abeliophyllum distichum TaxID=126358 RepID=A0ABD1NWM3_9LAMI